MLLPGRLRELESLAECLARGWPALLVGGAGSGKSSLARIAAALAGEDELCASCKVMYQPSLPAWPSALQ